MKKLSKLFRRKKEIRVEKTIAEIRQKLEEQRENFLQNSKIGKEIVEMSKNILGDFCGKQNNIFESC